MRDSKETKAKMKDIAPGNEIDPILTRIDQLEELCTQLETTLKDTVTFDALAARITGKKTLKKRRAKREWSPEEKKAFHERMVVILGDNSKPIQKAKSSDSEIPQSTLKTDHPPVLTRLDYAVVIQSAIKIHAWISHYPRFPYFNKIIPV